MPTVQTAVEIAKQNKINLYRQMSMRYSRYARDVSDILIATPYANNFENAAAM